MTDLERDLTSLLNRHSVENASDTPDFVLARFMLDCLGAYNAASMRRAEWHSQPRTKEPTLADLKLPGSVEVRVGCVFENLGIRTLDELCATKPSTLRRAKNFGPQSYQEVVLALSKLGRSLASELTPPQPTGSSARRDDETDTARSPGDVTPDGGVTTGSIRGDPMGRRTPPR